MRTILVIACAIALALPPGSSRIQVGAANDKAGVAAIRDHLDAGRYPEAESAARAWLAQVEQRDGMESAATAAALDLLVETLWRGGNTRAADARDLADRAVALKERLYGRDHLETAASRHNLANLLAERGDHKAAVQLLQEVLRTREQQLGPIDVTVAAALHDLALELSAGGAYERARELHERALSIREKRLGPEHAAIASSLSSLATLLKDMGRYPEADPLFRWALAMREKLFGPEHVLVASTLHNLAFLQIELGNYDEARRMYDRVIEIYERVYGPEHQALARALTNVAIATAQSGNYGDARQLFARALAVMELALGSNHPDVASAAMNLGVIDQRIGDLASARRLYERALALREAVLPADHPDIGESLHNLGSVFRAVGDHVEATRLYERALAIREKAYGPQHRAVASTLNNMGAVAWALGDLAGAEARYRRSLSILEKAVGPNHLQVAEVLTSLAPVLHDRRQTDAAEQVLRRALSIYETAYGAAHPYAAAAHENLAFNYHQRGHHAQARAEYERAFEIRAASLGPEHPDAGAGLVGLATELLEQGELAEAFRVAQRAESITRAHVRMTASTLPERQALALAAERRSGLDLALTIAVEHAEAVPEAPTAALDLLIRGRALVLDEMAVRQRDPYANAEPEVQSARQQLISARRRLANAIVRGPGRGGIEPYRRQLDQARAEHERAERQLAERHAAFRRESIGTRAGLAEVVSALPESAALVAYARYSPQPAANPSPQTAYVAFVVRRGAPVHVVRIDRGGRIEALIQNWRQAITAGAKSAAGERSVRVVGAALRRAIWDPLAPAIGTARIVLVVPDGALNLVNLAALPDRDRGYLVESGPLLHYVSAERDLVTLDAPRPEPAPANGLLAIGGAAFGAVSGAAAGSAPGRAAPEQRSGATQLDCDAFGAIRFEPLPGAAREAAEIVALWRDAAARDVAAGAGMSRPVSYLSGRGATEAAFKRLAPGHRVLHLATHGVFIDGACGSATAATRGVGGLASSPRVSSATTHNPLHLSGLALAGANRRSAAGADDEDGIVTAGEIASLDLSGADWAVLSACDTGLGEIRAGEGVLGLRRAFAVAGARTTIMSLWSVEDRSTREWMAALYRARLLEQRSTAEAVRDAARWILQARRAHGTNTHPFFWAAFVAAGDWR